MLFFFCSFELSRTKGTKAMKNGMLHFEWGYITSHNFKRDRCFDLFHFSLFPTPLHIWHFCTLHNARSPETRPNAKSFGYNGVHVGCKYYAQVMQPFITIIYRINKSKILIEFKLAHTQTRTRARATVWFITETGIYPSTWDRHLQIKYTLSHLYIHQFETTAFSATLIWNAEN